MYMVKGYILQQWPAKLVWSLQYISENQEFHKTEIRSNTTRRIISKKLPFTFQR